MNDEVIDGACHKNTPQGNFTATERVGAIGTPRAGQDRPPVTNDPSPQMQQTEAWSGRDPDSSNPWILTPGYLKLNVKKLQFWVRVRIGVRDRVNKFFMFKLW